MVPGAGDKKAEKSYLASAVDSINPWAGNRATTATPNEPQPSPTTPAGTGDHIINPLYGKSFKTYPPDCPKLNVQWFHAADVPKRKPKFPQKGKQTTDDEKKPIPRPKKFVTFSSQDSKAIETAYQKRLEELEREPGGNTKDRAVRIGLKRPRAVSGADGPNTNLECGDQVHTKVPVNEDFLFDVDIEERELAPIYWLGPVYEVRRGSWFYPEGRPCDENLAAQLEEGYLKTRPWQYPVTPRSNTGTQGVTPKPSSENLRADAAAQSDGASKPTTPRLQHQPQTYRLFGTYMNSVVTYQDSTTAWLSSEGVLSWVASTVYERFSGGGYMGGVKLVRGYSEPKKAKEEKTKEDKRPSTPTGTKSNPIDVDEKTAKMLKRRSAPPSTRPDTAERSSSKEDDRDEEPDLESRQNFLTRKLSNLLESNPEEKERAIRKRDEEEIRDDYNSNVGDSQGREIEHLVLVTHGIGQLLSLRMESINFVHDVNVLRKTLKSVYSSSADLKALNGEIGEGGLGNSRVQVLPLCWRHLLSFPNKQKDKQGEHDLTDVVDEDDEYPSLDDITVEGVAFARSLISDLALDVLLYQSAYREQISEIVLKESNRIYKLFMERNPGFKGKVHVMGHSLGSAILFDILCRQKEKNGSSESSKNPLRFWPSQDRYESKEPKELKFDFEVEDFYCLGSPIGLFQMLKGRSIAARRLPNALPSESPLNLDYMDDPFLSASAPSAYPEQRVSPVTGLPYSISSPKCGQLFNIFNPSDPIAYRIEPLISAAMSSLKPQGLPYTKKGIFHSVSPHGLTGIGSKVGQSVSGLWSSVSAGIANSLLHRSLGLTQDDVNSITASQQQQQQQNQPPTSRGAGTNISGGVISETSLSDAVKAENAAARKLQLAKGTGKAGKTSMSGNEMTLIDDELETLFSRFLKQRAGITDGKGAEGTGGSNNTAAAAWLEEERKAQKIRREEMKVRALNRNGRVDYCVQESVLDFNPINTIASHMGYWQDEDVVHFVLSQLLSSKAQTPKGKV